MRKLLSIAVSFFLISATFAQSNFSSQLPIKERKGTNIMGVVEADGKAMQGVIVSDGYQITTTDKKGCYWLNSEKKNGNVFITIPSGYEVNAEAAMPQFWALLTAPVEELERHDFSLKAVDNNRHAIMAITDIHLANQSDDMKQFKTKFMPRLNYEVDKYRSQGIPVYTICMGDSSFDTYWYDYLYDIGSFRKTLEDVQYPTAVFHAMGNHDNDGATPYDDNTDFNAAAKYRKAFGPTYYSLNIGQIHYIILDNVVYINKPTPDQKAGKNIAGSRNYKHYVSQEQLDWLTKDLSFVKDKTTPIVIAMHCPVLRYKNLNNGPINILTEEQETAKFLEILKDYKDVHFLTGHNHRNLTCHGCDDPTKPMISNIIDHNISAVCGAWWIPGSRGGLTISKEGMPAGFEIFTINDKNMEWYFSSIDEGADVQFRTFDMNTVRKYYREDPEMIVFYYHYPPKPRFDLRKCKDNRVDISVYAWETTWKISVREVETDKILEVVESPSECPLAIPSFYAIKTVWDRSFRSKYGSRSRYPHMFHTTASAPDTTLEITVTDGFGRIYKETMTRPKEFSKMMN